jgi:hypothetical protein
MLDPPMRILDDVAGVSLVPAPVEVLGDQAELDDQIIGEIVRFDLAALFAPQTNQIVFVIKIATATFAAVLSVP